MPTLDKEFYDTRELAELLGVAEITVRRLTERGDLPYYRVGRQKRFRRADLVTYLDSVRVAQP
jgi:excisionase family DNA binding protein